MRKCSYTESTRKWYILATVAIGIFLATIDASIVNIALPVLQRDLHTDFAIVEWVVLAYLMTVTTLMPGIGRLADMIGKKPIYVAGMALEDATSAPATVQVIAMNETLHVIVGLVMSALLLSLWALRQERRMRAVQATTDRAS